LKNIYTYHSDDRTTFRSLLSPDFFDALFKGGNPGIKAKRMLPMELSFRKLLASLLQVISVLSVLVQMCSSIYIDL
ncbi:hypothetical protein P4H35_12260, partial [Paenibacillus taichungensis]|uniref:hypothetical protein n=1 Tax=Paenibacillus taichungensis TaxID=484184 RepID=UPI002DBAFB7C